MIDEIYDEENYEDIEVEVENVKTKKNKQKIRRSRIIINELGDTNEKKEVYDPETKYKKNLISAYAFNDQINSCRKRNSKHFLKRKVKAAFEREPIEKGKGFNFNVPFIPTALMFVPPQPVPQIQVSNGPPVRNPNFMAGRSEQPKVVINSNNPSLNKDSTNTNIERTNSNSNLPKVNPVSTTSTVSTNLFSTSTSTSGSNTTPNTSGGPIKFQTTPNTNISRGSHFMISQNNPPEQKLVLPTTSTTNTNTNPQPVNTEYIRQQQIRYRQMYEVYKTDPEKLKREVGIEEYTKFIHFLKLYQNNQNRQREAATTAGNLQQNK